MDANVIREAQDDSTDLKKLILNLDIGKHCSSLINV